MLAISNENCEKHFCNTGAKKYYVFEIFPKHFTNFFNIVGQYFLEKLRIKPDEIILIKVT